MNPTTTFGTATPTSPSTPAPPAPASLPDPVQATITALTARVAALEASSGGSGGTTITVVVASEPASPVYYNRGNLTSNAYKDITADLATKFGYDSTKQAAVAAALAAGKRVELSFWGQQCQLGCSAVGGSGTKVGAFGFNPFADTGGSKSFVDYFEIAVVPTKLNYEFAYNYSVTTGADFPTRGSCAKRQLSATCYETYDYVPAGLELVQFTNAPVVTPSGKIFLWFRDQFALITSVDFYINGMSIVIFG